MFNKHKPFYSVEELNQYLTRLETLDRLMEKSKRNYLGGGQLESDKRIWEGYTKSLMVAQEAYQRMLAKVER